MIEIQQLQNLELPRTSQKYHQYSLAMIRAIELCENCEYYFAFYREFGSVENLLAAPFLVRRT